MPLTPADDEVNRLREEYVSYRERRAMIRYAVEAEYKSVIDREVRSRQEAADKDMARVISDALEAGIPSSKIRSGVLHTNVWSAWLKWKERIANLSVS